MASELFNIRSPQTFYGHHQEGIVFSFQYGMEVMQAIGMDIKVIRAGNTKHVPQSHFPATLASVSSYVIELYDTDGAAGAAKGAGIGAGIYASPQSFLAHYGRS